MTEKNSKQKVDNLSRELNKQINGLKQDYEASLASTEGIVQQMSNKFEQLYEVDGIHIRINCLKCNGQGWLPQQDKTKVICPVCKGKKYMWAIAWKPETVVNVK